MTRHIKARFDLLATLCGLAMFLFPWITVKCSGDTLASQTGWQTFAAEITLNESIVPQEQSSADKELSDYAILAGIGAAAGLCAAITAIFAIGGKRRSSVSVIAAVVAAGFIVAQTIYGFPLERQAEEEISNARGPTVIVTIERTPWLWTSVCFFLAPAALCVVPTKTNGSRSTESAGSNVQD